MSGMSEIENAALSGLNMSFCDLPRALPWASERQPGGLGTHAFDALWECDPNGVKAVSPGQRPGDRTTQHIAPQRGAVLD